MKQVWRETGVSSRCPDTPKGTRGRARTLHPVEWPKEAPAAQESRAGDPSVPARPGKTKPAQQEKTNRAEQHFQCNGTARSLIIRDFCADAETTASAHPRGAEHGAATAQSFTHHVQPGFGERIINSLLHPAFFLRQRTLSAAEAVPGPCRSPTNGASPSPGQCHACSTVEF